MHPESRGNHEGLKSLENKRTDSQERSGAGRYLPIKADFVIHPGTRPDPGVSYLRLKCSMCQLLILVFALESADSLLVLR